MFDIRVSKYLPKTVMDKDGHEVELLGVIVSGDPFQNPYGQLLQDGTICPERIVVIAGNAVQPDHF